MKSILKALVIFMAIGLFACAPSNNDSETTSSEKRNLFIDSLIQKMTLEEKIGQMALYTSGWTITGASLNKNYKKELQEGKVGAIFNAHTVEYNKELQKIAIEETRLGIPLLFGYDVIHGHKTIYPIPLAESCSWNLDLIKKSAKLSAKEAAASGINWTFNPMVDICRDPRWGRIAEGSGEDPYLGSLIAKAKVEGYQGDDLSDPFTILACVKHFAAYGAPFGGRDYNIVDMSERSLREVYLPPYKAAIDAGVATVMTSFNEINGTPATASKFLFTELLREEWGFDGFVVTDYTAINELVPHGVAANEKEAAKLALDAGVDMDMQGSVYNNYLKELVDEKMVDEAQINQFVRNILIMKYKLGLFDDPYRYLNLEREKEVVQSEELKNHALEAAKESIVLLKNESFNGEKILPISKSIKSIAVIGPLGNSKIDLLGSWHAAGKKKGVTSLFEAIKKNVPGSKVKFAKGCDINGDRRDGFKEAIRLAKSSDVVVLAVGENFKQSGEAASRTEIGLPGIQLDLVKELQKTGKPIAVLVMAGRPLTIEWINDNVPTILYTWQLGTMAGEAIAQVLFGDCNPSGKLTATFPRNVGQIPIYYSMKNTGRPFDAVNKYSSKYIDAPNEPLYPFGFGLSYTNFEYSDLNLSKEEISFKDTLSVKIKVTNTGKYAGKEVVQLYTRDLVGSVTRPLKELKAFEKISLQPGESKTLTFTLDAEDLAFYTKNMIFKAEPGEFIVYVGTNSVDCLEAKFKLKN